MKTPCQVVHWHLLPAITAQLAAQLKKISVPQKQIAVLLGVTPAAVSQYLNKKRGLETALSKTAKQQIKQLARKLKQQKVSNCELILSVCSICSNVRRSGSVCSVHAREFNATKGCNICWSGKHEC